MPNGFHNAEMREADKTDLIKEITAPLSSNTQPARENHLVMLSGRQEAVRLAAARKIACFNWIWRLKGNASMVADSTPV